MYYLKNFGQQTVTLPKIGVDIKPGEVVAVQDTVLLRNLNEIYHARYFGKVRFVSASVYKKYIASHKKEKSQEPIQNEATSNKEATVAKQTESKTQESKEQKDVKQEEPNQSEEEKTNKSAKKQTSKTKKSSANKKNKDGE